MLDKVGKLRGLKQSAKAGRLPCILRTEQVPPELAITNPMGCRNYRLGLAIRIDYRSFFVDRWIKPCSLEISNERRLHRGVLKPLEAPRCHFWPPNGQRISGEPRAEGDERVRCMRVLGSVADSEPATARLPFTTTTPTGHPSSLSKAPPFRLFA